MVVAIPPIPMPTVEQIVDVLLSNERERIIRDATKLIQHIETNLAMLRGALERDDLRSFSRYAEPFDEALAARAELLEDFEGPIKRAQSSTTQPLTDGKR